MIDNKDEKIYNSSLYTACMGRKKRKQVFEIHNYMIFDEFTEFDSYLIVVGFFFWGGGYFNPNISRNNILKLYENLKNTMF